MLCPSVLWAYILEFASMKAKLAICNVCMKLVYNIVLYGIWPVHGRGYAIQVFSLSIIECNNDQNTHTFFTQLALLKVAYV